MTISRTAVAKVIRKIMTETSRGTWRFNVNSTHHFTPDNPIHFHGLARMKEKQALSKQLKFKEIKNVS